MVQILLLFARAQRDGLWQLHLHAFKLMLLFFFPVQSHQLRKVGYRLHQFSISKEGYLTTIIVYLQCVYRVAR